MIRTLLIMLFFASTIEAKIKSLIIDTDGKKAYYYRVLQELGSQSQFTYRYKNIYDMIEDPTIDADIEAIFFFASPQFISHIGHAITKEIMHTIKIFSQKHGKLIVLLLPNYASPKLLAQFLENSALTNHVSSKNIAHIYTKYLGHPNAQIGKQYGTSLINKTSHTIKPAIPQNTPANLLFLPQSNEYADHKLALCLYNKKTDSICALLPTTDVTFADIAENFHKNPHAIIDRNKLLMHTQQVLLELSSLHRNHTVCSKKISRLPSCFYKQPNKKKKSFSAAWLEPKDFYLHEEPSLKKNPLTETCTRECSFLSDCNFDLIWFEVNPEWYFSPRALYKKDHDAVMQIMHTIGTHLKNNARPSRLFIGSDITSNFNGQKPNHCVYDLYGTAYPNIPSPFDVENFWQQELIDPFIKCYKELCSACPIDGLFLDFEMYHAPRQSTSYHDLMDFSDCAWKTFKNKNPHIPWKQNVSERVCYLKEHKLFTHYFDCLTNAIADIGLHIKKSLNNLNPKLAIALYAPTLPSSWFYRGITKSLSSVKKPILMATFNTDHLLHQPWLKKQGIHLLHASAFMMSKLADEYNTLLPQLTKTHDFVWYNRPSRQLYQQGIVHKYTDKWWASEYSPLENDTITKILRSTHQKNHSFY